MSRFDRSETVRNFDEEVEQLRADMIKRREDFWKEAEDRDNRMEAERERWLKRTDDLWNDMVESSRREFESFGRFSDFENDKDEIRKERTESFTSRRTPERDEEGREFLANFRSKLRSDHSKDNLDDVFKSLDDFVERRKSKHTQSSSETSSRLSSDRPTKERCESRTESVKEERSSTSSRPSKNFESERSHTSPNSAKSCSSGTTVNSQSTSGKGNDEEVKVSHNIIGNQRNIEVNSRKETKDGDCYSVREVKQTISVPAEADLDEVTSTLPSDCKEILKKAALNVK